MKPRIYDKNGVEKDEQWMIAKYGPIEHHMAENLDQDEEFWAVLRIQESIGPASLKVRVLDLDGSPREGEHVAFHWSTAPQQPPGCESQWERRFVHQKTDSGGYSGFGMGRGSYYWIEDPAPENIGPHKAFVCGGTKSDMINGLGYLKGTNHAGMLDIVFGLVKYHAAIPQHPPIDHDHTVPSGNLNLEARVHGLEDWAKSF